MVLIHIFIIRKRKNSVTSKRKARKLAANDGVVKLQSNVLPAYLLLHTIHTIVDTKSKCGILFHHAEIEFREKL